MVDVIFWIACTVVSLTKSIANWDVENGFIFALFMCFYGIFLVYRLGVRNKIRDALIKKCKDNYIDLSDIFPSGSY